MSTTVESSIDPVLKNPAYILKRFTDDLYRYHNEPRRTVQRGERKVAELINKMATDNVKYGLTDEVDLWSCYFAGIGVNRALDDMYSVRMYLDSLPPDNFIKNHIFVYARKTETPGIKMYNTIEWSEAERLYETEGDQWALMAMVVYRAEPVE